MRSQILNQVRREIERSLGKLKPEDAIISVRVDDDEAFEPSATVLKSKGDGIWTFWASNHN